MGDSFCCATEGKTAQGAGGERPAGGAPGCNPRRGAGAPAPSLPPAPRALCGANAAGRSAPAVPGGAGSAPAGPCAPREGGTGSTPLGAGASRCSAVGRGLRRGGSGAGDAGRGADGGVGGGVRTMGCGCWRLLGAVCPLLLHLGECRRDPGRGGAGTPGCLPRAPPRSSLRLRGCPVAPTLGDRPVLQNRAWRKAASRHCPGVPLPQDPSPGSGSPARSSAQSACPRSPGSCWAPALGQSRHPPAAAALSRSSQSRGRAPAPVPAGIPAPKGDAGAQGLIWSGGGQGPPSLGQFWGSGGSCFRPFPRSVPGAGNALQHPGLPSLAFPLGLSP